MDEQVQCTACGALILAPTAQENGGRCIPCARGTRQATDAGRRLIQASNEAAARARLRAEEQTAIELTRPPWPALGWETLRAIWRLVKAFAISFAFCGIGSAIAPLIAIGWFIGAVPNLLGAAVCWLFAGILLLLLPIHALYAFILACINKRADYSKGIYGAAAWIEERQLFNPTHQAKRGKLPAGAA